MKFKFDLESPEQSLLSVSLRFFLALGEVSPKQKEYSVIHEHIVVVALMAGDLSAAKKFFEVYEGYQDEKVDGYYLSYHDHRESQIYYFREKIEGLELQHRRD